MPIPVCSLLGWFFEKLRPYSAGLPTPERDFRTSLSCSRAGTCRGHNPHLLLNRQFRGDTTVARLLLTTSPWLSNPSEVSSIRSRDGGFGWVPGEPAEARIPDRGRRRLIRPGRPARRGRSLARERDDSREGRKPLLACAMDAQQLRATRARSLGIEGIRDISA